MPTLTPLVFTDSGAPIGYIYHAWDKAVRAIGKPGLLFRNLRNSFIIEQDRRGMPRAVIKSLVGHRTDSMFEHYRIVGKTDMDNARRLMDGGNPVGSDSGKPKFPKERS